MKTSKQTFSNWTTVCLEIEHDTPCLDKILNELKYTTVLEVSPCTIVYTYDEDIRIGHRIVFATNRGQSIINATIDDITEILYG